MPLRVALVLAAVGWRAPAPVIARTLAFDERVDHALAVERVLEARRAVGRAQGGLPARRVTREAIVRRVERDLKRSALAEAAGDRITADLLQAEMDRQAGSSQDRLLLRELHRALGDDPYLIAECLARPVVAAKLFLDRHGSDAALDGAVLPSGWREPHLDEALSPPSRSGMLCTASGSPGAREQATAVFTGTEILLWGGRERYAPEEYADVGLRYDPGSDRWSTMSQGPAGRAGHAFAWSGSRLYIWGGGTLGNDGAAYHPSTDTWDVLPASGLQPRSKHTAVFTGSELIVWGGRWGSLFNPTFYRDGARYDPSTRTWAPTPISATTPSTRAHHVAVWTGTEMVVWGGGTDFNGWPTGGRYDPLAGVWRPTSTTGAPSRYFFPNAVWTGSEMAIWLEGFGGLYDPVADSWRRPSSPPWGGGEQALLVWTGREVMSWGCKGSGSCNGTSYDPATDSWSLFASGSGVPGFRTGSSLAWMGGELLVWGGSDGAYLSTGGRYDVAAARWRPTSIGTWIPPGRSEYGSVWTGAEMLVYGGRGNGGGACAGGARYVPAIDAWLPVSTAGDWPGPMSEHAAVWTGRELMVWGPNGYPFPRSSALYDPASDSWRVVSLASAPGYARWPEGVWTGSEVLIWGGLMGSTPTPGGRYDPATDTWRVMSTVGEPSARHEHTAVWTGTEMVVWGGTPLGVTGGRYDPATDRWRPTSTGTGVPSPRFGHTMVWTGSRAIVWGGSTGQGTYFGDGGIYDPVLDAWQSLPSGGASRRTLHTAVFTGNEMIVWGGYNGSNLGAGARFDPVTGIWSPVSSVQAPSRRFLHRAVFTGQRMIVWGGWPDVADGGAYDPVADSWDCGISGADVLAGKTSSLGSPGQSARGYRVNGTMLVDIVDAFPTFLGGGLRVAGGDVDTGGLGEIVAAPGPNALHPPNVRGFDAGGVPISGLDFMAYGATGFGANSAAGAIDGAERILTGPGASPAYGPHVRAFGYASGSVSPVSGVSFYAYGTLRYGVNPGSGALDGDAFEEIVTGPGSGIPFGPHVRGWDYDGATLRAIPAVSFYAYGTLRWGAEVAAGDVDADGFAELLTGPGPGPAFATQLRGFDVDGGVVRPKPGVNAVIFPGASYGLNAGAGDVDADGREEILCGPGPDPAIGSTLAAFRFSGGALTPIPTLSFDVFGSFKGLRVGSAALD